MRRLLLLTILAALAAAPAMAQLQQLEVAFGGVNCEPCLESMPARAKRIRGVANATVDTAKGLLRLELAESNRVRIEQIRDLIEQDGTKALRATRVTVSGVLERSGEQWLLRIPQHPQPLELGGTPAASWTVGATVQLTGSIDNLKRTPLLLEVAAKP